MVFQPLHTSSLGALCLLHLLSDGAVVLWLVLSQGRVCLLKQSWTTLQGQSEQELSRRYQIAVALGVGEGITRPTGADTPDRPTARSRRWQWLLPHFISHFVVDGGTKLHEDEAESNHRQSTEEGSQENGQPHVRLVQRVSPCPNEGENGGEDEKHAVAVHGECDGKVSGQAAPHKELVHCCPVMGVKAHLYGHHNQQTGLCQ